MHKPNRRPSRVIFGRIPPELGDALNRYIESLQMKPTMTSVICVCIEDFLEKNGFWSVKESKNA